jgi:hypothetical protein
MRAAAWSCTMFAKRPKKWAEPNIAQTERPSSPTRYVSSDLPSHLLERGPKLCRCAR